MEAEAEASAEPRVTWVRVYNRGNEKEVFREPRFKRTASLLAAG